MHNLVSASCNSGLFQDAFGLSTCRESAVCTVLQGDPVPDSAPMLPLNQQQLLFEREYS